jgi:hypothetical protein
MRQPTFIPGFRISLFDTVFLTLGIAGSLFLATKLWWAGFVVGLVILHFFAFCNVFRITRRSELVWAGAFVLVCGSTITTGFPGWIATGVASVGLSSFLIWRETKYDDYHGIFWQIWNPGLRGRWERDQGIPARELDGG